MAIADWSGRRVAAMWALGVIAEVIVIAGPLLFGAWYVGREGPRLMREMAGFENRLRVAEEADSISVVVQRREAIRAGTFSVDSSGDTVVAVVRAPVFPDSLAVAAQRRRIDRVARISVALWFGAIPVTLLVITGMWLFGRRRSARL
jgi:hypothetical protein